MEQTTPLIYSRVPQAGLLSLRGRAAALGVAIGCLIPLLLAVRLHPSPTGVATHTEMGFQQCRMLQVTGIPCPSCGMTTSWSWLVRGNVVASLYVQPMGTVLALIAIACVWGGFYIAITGRPLYRLLAVLPGRYYFIPLLAFGLLDWGWKIYIHLSGKDGLS